MPQEKNKTKSFANSLAGENGSDWSQDVDEKRSWNTAHQQYGADGVGWNTAGLICSCKNFVMAMSIKKSYYLYIEQTPFPPYPPVSLLI